MAQTVVQFSMDEDLKQRMEQVCQTTGITLTAAFLLFAQTVSHQEQIPINLADPFYSEENRKHLLRGVAALDAGKGVEHELLDAED